MAKQSVMLKRRRTNVGTQELNQDTVSTKTKKVESQSPVCVLHDFFLHFQPNVQNEKEGDEINTNGSYTDDVITRFDKLTRKSVNASTVSNNIPPKNQFLKKYLTYLKQEISRVFFFF